MDMFSYIYNPIVTPGIIAVVFIAVILLVVIRQMATIGKALSRLGAKVWTRAGFFWTVNLIFMAVSILHAGIFFGIAGDGHDMPGIAQYLGFAVSFFLDLVTIILMQAMLEARYRGEEGRARQFLLFIAICCGTSTFANLAISLNDFNAAAMLPHAPWAIQVASPYVLASFPLFVIMMSIAAEMIVNVRPLESLNAEEYEADEKKRLKMLEIRNTYLQKQADEELRAFTIRAQMRANKQLRKGQVSGSFRWFWEKPRETEAVIAEVTSQLKALYEPQIESLKRRLEDVQAQMYSADRLASAIQVEHNDPLTPVPQTIPEYADETQQNSGPLQLNAALLAITRDYPRVASEWLANNRKTATLEEIMEVTGHSKRRLNKAPLRRTSRNPELVLLTSVFEWLKTAPLPGSLNGSLSGELPAISSILSRNQNGTFERSGEASAAYAEMQPSWISTPVSMP